MTTEYNESVKKFLDKMPPAVRMLPVSDRGFPVPFFVGWPNGVADFRTIDGAKLGACIKRKLCWVCGEHLAAGNVTFIVGPMCTVNRVAPEPPSHYKCALFSALACPFLNNPRTVRNAKAIPDNVGMPGMPIMRNPGVTALWTTRLWHPFHPLGDKTKVMFQFETPSRVEWYKESRPAMREEVTQSIRDGMPALVDAAIPEGKQSIMDLMASLIRARAYLPAGLNHGFVSSLNDDKCTYCDRVEDDPIHTPLDLGLGEVLSNLMSVAESLR